MEKSNQGNPTSDTLQDSLAIKRKAKGTVQVLRIALNRGAHYNLSTIRENVQEICGEACSASIIIRRAFEVYLTHLINILQGNRKSKSEQEAHILKEHLSKRSK